MLKTLLSHLREFKRVSILTPIFVVLEVVMEVLIPLMMAAIIDNGVEKGNMAYVYRTGLLMVLMAMLSLFSAPAPDAWPPRPAAALPATCAGECLQISSASPFPTWTNIPPPVWSPV